MGPSIFDRTESPVKIVIFQQQSPGDILMLTGAIRDLHSAYPGKFLTDIRTSADSLFENNPYISALDENDPNIFLLKAQYSEGRYNLINRSNEGPWHFIHGFRKDFEDKLGIEIQATVMKGDIHLSDTEKGWLSQVYEIVGKDAPYWLINAGTKSDFTCKQWEFSRYQAVIDALPQVPFVQIGSSSNGHTHRQLSGDNVMDLVGKTDLRQLVRLVYHSAGVITPVSLPMHLAAAVEMKPVYKRKTRPCIVIAGGREPNQWEAYPNHQYLHTCGQLPCCDNGGCWHSRVVPLDDGETHHDENVCERPVKTPSGDVVPKCMDLITLDEVVSHIHRYLMDPRWDYYRKPLMS
ncbi:MAG: glycosyltransferase family 9 protein [Proteobacteria bacterium]|nr:glycosyltransferase family 9 protein [Pseudomonadota bacterium]